MRIRSVVKDASNKNLRRVFNRKFLKEHGLLENTQKKIKGKKTIDMPLYEYLYGKKERIIYKSQRIV